MGAEPAAALRHGSLLSAHQARPDGDAAAASCARSRAAVRRRTRRTCSTTSRQRALSGFGGPLHDWPGFSNGIAGWCDRKASATAASRVPIRARHPAILHQLPAAPESRRVAVDAIRLTRRIVPAPRSKRFEPEEHLPGPNVQTDDEILAYARQTVITVDHQSGTCKMGAGPDGGRDERLRVRGISGSRAVVSIMPNVVSGNTNAPTMMIAEKGRRDESRPDRRAGAKRVPRRENGETQCEGTVRCRRPRHDRHRRAPAASATHAADVMAANGAVVSR